MAPMTRSGSSVRNQNISVSVSFTAQGAFEEMCTLLAGFVFSFSKIFWDCSLVAVGALIATDKSKVSSQQGWWIG